MKYKYLIKNIQIIFVLMLFLVPTAVFVQEGSVLEESMDMLADTGTLPLSKEQRLEDKQEYNFFDKLQELVKKK